MTFTKSSSLARSGRASRRARTITACAAVAAVAALGGAQAASADEGFVDGIGETIGSPTNTFRIDTFFQGGVLQYAHAASGKVFNGEITCLNVKDNAATIVADDPNTGLRNHTFVQDNGASGDKARNTLFNPAKLSPASRAKASACISPDLNALNAVKPLVNGSIRVGTYNSSTPTATARKKAKRAKKSKSSKKA